MTQEEYDQLLMPRDLTTPPAPPSPDKMPPLERDAGRQIVGGVSNALFPHLTDPATYGPQPSPFFQDTPGKIPQVEGDQRIQGAVADIGNALNFTIPMGGPTAGAAKLAAPFIFARRALKEAEGIPVKGLQALHSSPHDFGAFDLTKMGTGEGGQYFSRGHYFAESPDVSGRGGHYWEQNLGRYEGPEKYAAEVLQGNNFDRAEAIAEARTTFAKDEPFGKEVLRLLESGKPVGPRTYVVDVNAKPETMMNFDVPMADQPPAVLNYPGIMDAIRKEARSRALDARNPAEADRLYLISQHPELGKGEFALRGLETKAKQESGDYGRTLLMHKMREADIPGLVFLDARSRNRQPIRQTYDQLNETQKLIQDIEKQGRAPNPVIQSRLRRLQHEVENPPTQNIVKYDNDITILRKLGLIGGAIPAAGAMGNLARQDNYQ